VIAVESLAGKGHSVLSACDYLSLSRATYYRDINPTPSSQESPRGVHPSSLTFAEEQQVIAELNSDRFSDVAIPQVYATLLDEGQYFCSQSTMYRLLHANEMLKERRRLTPRTHYPRPELLATAPNQVWSWDITKLKGPVKWSYFYLYVILDIFSRMVVGWLVAERERSDIARELIEECCIRQAIQPGQLTLHADRGSSMQSKPVAHLLSDLGVTKSHSRPYVSDDNPFSESNFKTLKYRPEFPDRFGSIEDSRSLCRDFFPWYNDVHHHSGIAMLTPSEMHYGRGEDVLKARHATMMQAFAANPRRFNGHVPKQQELPKEVWINRPLKEEVRLVISNVV
jgi:putative transposase